MYRFFTTLAAGVVASALNASPSVPAAGKPTNACTDPGYQQFDFWLGDWKVQLADGRLAGYNRVERILNGCAVRESYRTPKGYRGTSLNTYDPEQNRWHQVWIDNQGQVLELDGHLVDGSMVLSGNSRDSAGLPTLERITWKSESDGRVRQRWERSRNNGHDWEVVFEGFYRSE